ncbi:Inositol-pentakisphosphate 2-kinase [Colletotrichum chlorophyti]|uniref:Inositol-pentakisphosphate 2-kinase n=1 Tax=Colletotrichum chlorophyti TaxID=708187 RepID=A0A1Q8RN78_9PEZI|nr:Inositol-pentakisphosphate 2-kinase [Colletotrichum chlorophyti]
MASSKDLTGDVPFEKLPDSASGFVFSADVSITHGRISRHPWTHALYIGEGAANVLFEPLLSETVKHHRGSSNQRVEDGVEKELFSKYLMRVAKQPKDPKKPFYSAEAQFDYYQKKISPLFKSHIECLVDEKLAWVPSVAIQYLQQNLKGLDAAGGRQPDKPARPSKFVGDQVGSSRNILLVESMLPRKDREEFLVEFKPKWLAQSPSAPKEADTCRCCALAAKKYNKTKDANYDPARYPCPLWLDPERPTPERKKDIRRTAIATMFKDNPHAEVLYELLKKTSLIPLLKKVQVQKDPKGPLKAGMNDDGLPIAMTLRDCSLFIRYRVGRSGAGKAVVDEGSFEAKLSDLDIKNVAWKLSEWQDKERALVEQGWYTGRGKMKHCALQK